MRSAIDRWLVYASYKEINRLLLAHEPSDLPFVLPTMQLCLLGDLSCEHYKTRTRFLDCIDNIICSVEPSVVSMFIDFFSACSDVPTYVLARVFITVNSTD